jgi:hypothetical protein
VRDLDFDTGRAAANVLTRQMNWPLARPRPHALSMGPDIDDSEITRAATR